MCLSVCALASRGYALASRVSGGEDFSRKDPIESHVIQNYVTNSRGSRLRISLKGSLQLKTRKQSSLN
jgi:hypothetical protein